MSDFSNSELRRLDLTLLLVFLGLLRHRKATDVASELGLTQSAISQALRRLRDIFEDELFLRRPHGMEPTATALALEAPIEKAVEALRGALGAARAFDPAAARGAVTIAALDAEQAVLIPRLVGRLRKSSPGLNLSVVQIGRRQAVEALADGRVDLSIGFLWDVPEFIAGERVYEESFLVVARRALLPDAPEVSLDSYCGADHVLVSPAGDLRGVVDDQLALRGRERRIVLGLPTFLPAFAAVSSFAALVTLPARIALTFAPRFGLTTAEPPFNIRSFPVSVFWHRRNHNDPRTLWLRHEIQRCV